MHAPSLHRRLSLAPVLLGVLGAARVLAGDPSTFDATREARAFLRDYVGLTATSDVAVVSLYRDDARLQISAMAANQEVRTAAVSGRNWKRQLRAGWYDASSQLEASSFRDVAIARQGDRVVIRAKRYSQTRCYWDPNYLVSIEPNAGGVFEIVEERITFQHSSRCPTSGSAQPDASAPAAPVHEPSGRPSNLPANAIPISSSPLAVR
ncbi:MAG: hypothetical protein ABI589_10885 [Burkholderiales bacterium]